MRHGHLFDHVRDGVVPGETEGAWCKCERLGPCRETLLTLEETEDPGDTVVPPRLVDVGPEDKIAALEVGRGSREAGDDDDDRADHGPGESARRMAWIGAKSVETNSTHQKMAVLLMVGRVRRPKMLMKHAPSMYAR